MPTGLLSFSPEKRIVSLSNQQGLSGGKPVVGIRRRLPVGRSAIHRELHSAIWLSSSGSIAKAILRSSGETARVLVPPPHLPLGTVTIFCGFPPLCDTP